MTNKQMSNGIALIQVLLITGVLSVLALFLTYTAKEQVTIANWADDKALALVNVHSAESKLLFTLLTEKKLPKISNDEDQNTDASLASKWNFFAKPFMVDEMVQVKIQDQSALLHANFPNKERMLALIKSQGFSATEANTLYDSLLDWQDIDSITRLNGAEADTYSNQIRNGAVPDVHDFKFIKAMTPELHQVLIENTTIYKKGVFNPANSPFTLLSALTNTNIAEQIIALRNKNQLTKRIFSEISGINEGEGVYFYPSNFFAIKLSSEVGETKVLKNIILEISPYAQGKTKPINLFYNRG